MKSLKVVSLIQSCLITVILGYTDVVSIYDCYDCISGQGKIVCRDEKLERVAFCCAAGETGKGCTNKDICSSQALTLSMQMVSCPYIPKTCTSSSSSVVLKPNKTEWITQSQSANRFFNSSAICHFKITADLLSSNLSASEITRAQIYISVKSFQNVYVHLNNGTSIKTAEDAIQVNSFNTGLDFFYRASNNVIYLIFVAQGDNPSVNVSARILYTTDTLYQQQVEALKNASKPQNASVIVKNVNVTVNKIKSAFDQVDWKPSVSILTFLGIVLFGALIICVIECTYRKKDEPEFDIIEDFQFSERQNENQAQRQITTEQNLTVQDLLEETKGKVMNRRDHPGHYSMGTMGSGQYGLGFFQKSAGGNINTFRDASISEFKKVGNQQEIELGAFSVDGGSSIKPSSRFYGKVVPSELISNGSISIRGGAGGGGGPTIKIQSEKSFGEGAGEQIESSRFKGSQFSNRVVPISYRQQQQQVFQNVGGSIDTTTAASFLDPRQGNNDQRNPSRLSDAYRRSNNNSSLGL